MMNTQARLSKFYFSLIEFCSVLKFLGYQVFEMQTNLMGLEISNSLGSDNQSNLFLLYKRRFYIQYLIAGQLLKMINLIFKSLFLRFMLFSIQLQQQDYIFLQLLYDLELLLIFQCQESAFQFHSTVSYSQQKWKQSFHYLCSIKQQIMYLSSAILELLFFIDLGYHTE